MSKEFDLGIKKANALLQNKMWEEAVFAYEKIIQRSPSMFKVLQGNIDYAKKRIDPNKPESVKEVQITTSRKRIYLNDLYADVKERRASYRYEKDKVPLVTVVVTSHNTEDYIEACLESLISQTYPNIEIIVVDDLSTDLTRSIIERIIKSNGGVKLIKLAVNLGTYYAKNYGIKVSSGDYIFFQDSDDICHPERIALQMDLILQNPSAEVVRGAYSRVDPITSEIIPVNGLFSKLGLITLGVKKSVFSKVGYFNCTTKASDDEFFNRVIHFLGKKIVCNLDLPLYYNTMREGSLFADMVHWNDDGSIEQKPSLVRQNYVKSFQEKHKQIQIEQAPRIFSFPKIRDPIVVDEEMTKLANPNCSVIVNVCSIPEREKSLERVLRGISRQCDEIYLYLDRYVSVPEFVNKLEVPVKVYRSQDMPGLRDNGKFIRLDEISKHDVPCYYFTIDDDIDYPDDYVNAMIKHLQRFDNSVIAGVHGVTLRDKPNGYFSERRMVHSFTRSLEKPRLVNILGTGTVAFHTSIFKNFDLNVFSEPGMVDIFFAKECVIRNIPMLCVPRHDHWLKEIKIDNNITLFNEFRRDDSKQTAVLNSVDSWGMIGIMDVISKNKTISNFQSLANCKMLHFFTKN